jgi:hypothetical protein
LTRNLFHSFLYHGSRWRLQVVVHSRLDILQVEVTLIWEEGGVFEDNNSSCFLILELQLVMG